MLHTVFKQKNFVSWIYFFFFYLLKAITTPSSCTTLPKVCYLCQFFFHFLYYCIIGSIMGIAVPCQNFCKFELWVFPTIDFQLHSLQMVKKKHAHTFLHHSKIALTCFTPLRLNLCSFSCVQVDYDSFDYSRDNASVETLPTSTVQVLFAR